MREALISIAAGASQLPLLETARRMGLALVAVDRDPLAPGMRLADATVVASTHDPEAVLRGLGALPAGLRPCAVVTKSSGAPVATAALVAAGLGLPGLNPEHARDATTKPGQLALCERAGLGVPRHARVGAFSELVGLGFAPPFVCKPTSTLVGKRGVRLVRSLHEARPAFEAALAASPEGAVEVERYLPGHDVVLVGLFRDSRLEPVALFDEDAAFVAEGDVRGLGFRMPSRHAGTPLEALLAGEAGRLVERLRLGAGIVFATFRVAPRQVARRTGAAAHVLELHFDLAGDKLAEAFFPAATDFPLIERTIEALRAPFAAVQGAPPAGAPCRGPLVTRPTVLRFLHGRDLREDGERKLEALRQLAGLLELSLEEGREAAADGERVGYCLARGDARLAACIDRLLGREPVPGAFS